MRLPDFDVADIIAFVEHRLRPVIFPLLHDHPAAFQGAVLADLTAIWLAGHCVPDAVAATRALRADLFAAHLQAVERLTNLNAAMMGTPYDEPGDPPSVRKAFESRLSDLIAAYADEDRADIVDALLTQTMAVSEADDGA